MGTLVIRLDVPVTYYLLENNQLLIAQTLNPENVDDLLGEIGDYPVTEVCVYIKPDVRDDLDGVCIDKIIAESSEYQFYIGQDDYDFVKTVAFKFGAKCVKYFSSYRYYQSITTDGIVIDYYGLHNYIVANIFDGYYRSITVTSPERLHRTVSMANVSYVTYASRMSIPELVNVSNIDKSLLESVAFLQFIMYGSPCYMFECDTNEITDWWDRDNRPKNHVLSDEERKEILDTVKRGIKPREVRKRRTFNLADVAYAAAYFVASLIISVTLFTSLKIQDDFTVLETKIFEQKEHIDKALVEKKFLENSIERYDDPPMHDRLMALDSVLTNGYIMNVRFSVLGMKLTLYVTDEEMINNALSELADHYRVEGSEFEKNVVDEVSGSSFMQYDVSLLY